MCANLQTRERLILPNPQLKSSLNAITNSCFLLIIGTDIGSQMYRCMEQEQWFSVSNVALKFLHKGGTKEREERMNLDSFLASLSNSILLSSPNNWTAGLCLPTPTYEFDFQLSLQEQEMPSHKKPKNSRRGGCIGRKRTLCNASDL